MTYSAIDVHSLTKLFGQTLAVDSLSFSVPAGAVIGLLGGNGAGKTTTIAMLLGLLKPDDGQISLLGVDMRRTPWLALPRMNYSSPYVDLPRRLTVRQNLRVYGRLYGLHRLERRIDALSESLDLGSFVDRSIGSLSAGQMTRVHLAKALLNDPDLLMLDEPTASLDPDTGDHVRSYLEAYQARTGATILLASHNMAEVERLCDDVLMMRTGKIVDRDPPATLIERYGRDSLEQVFLDIARAPRSEAAE